MKKLGMCTLVLLIGAGMLVMGGCSDSDSATGAFPQSAAAYAGSSMPAPMDSTTAWNYYDLHSQVLVAAEDAFGRADLANGNDSGEDGGSGSNITEGDISGTYTETWNYKYTWGPTRQSGAEQWTEAYSDWQDSGDNWPYVMKGSGNLFAKYSDSVDFDGVEPEVPEPTLVGEYLGDDGMQYANYAALAESGVGYNDEYDGFVSQNYSASQMDSTTRTWEVSQSADVSYGDLVNDDYYGLLGATAKGAYDGSVSTLVASGTICSEEDGILDDGCLDYDIDLQWTGEVEDPNTWPEDGTIKISTVDASAMYDYSYTSDPDCYLYSLDADNDNAYEYTSLECD